jgi:hypothetical protein
MTMRYVVCITTLMFAATAASPAHADPLILNLAEAQIETTPDPNARPPKPGTTAPAPAQPPASDFPPLQPPEVITPIGTPDKTTTTTTTTTDAVSKSDGGLTGIQWLGIGVAVIAVGALAASGGGGDEPAPTSSGGN